MSYIIVHLNTSKHLRYRTMCAFISLIAGWSKKWGEEAEFKAFPNC